MQIDKKPNWNFLSWFPYEAKLLESQKDGGSCPLFSAPAAASGCLQKGSSSGWFIIPLSLSLSLMFFVSRSFNINQLTLPFVLLRRQTHILHPPLPCFFLRFTFSISLFLLTYPAPHLRHSLSPARRVRVFRYHLMNFLLYYISFQKMDGNGDKWTHNIHTHTHAHKYAYQNSYIYILNE